MAETVLAKLAVEITAKATQFGKSLGQIQGELNGFQKSVGNVSSKLQNAAAIFGIAFSTKVVTDFAFEVAKLAGEAEGVKAAFDKLPGSIALMGELKSATAGTVSELALMKRTVQAANFGIALESLPELLKFAAIRAQQTGQSVDYLVDSIITGIGRKSPLILDNLGISAVRLKEQFGGAALEAQSIGEVAKAVGRIATEELGKMGDFSENTSTKIQRLSASWDDLKVAIGNVANSTGVIGTGLNVFTNLLNAFAGDELTTGLNQLKSSLGSNAEILERFVAAGGKVDLSWQELMAKGFFRNEEAAKKFEKVLADIQKRNEDLREANAVEAVDPLTGMSIGGGTPWTGRLKEEIKTLGQLKDKIKELNDQFTNDTDVKDKTKLASIGNEIRGLELQVEALEKLRKKQEEVNNQSLSSFGQKQLKQAESGELDPFGGVKKVGLLPEQDRISDTTSPISIFPDETSTKDRGQAMIDTLKAIGDQYQLTADQRKSLHDIQKDLDEDELEREERKKQAAAEFGQIIGTNLGLVLSKQQSFSQAMKRITKDLIATFLSRALAAAISTSFSSSKNPIIGAALAAASSGVVLGLFSGLGASGGSHGAARPSVSNVNSSQREPFGSSVAFQAEFRISGNDLVAVASSQANRNKRLG